MSYDIWTNKEHAQLKYMLSLGRTRREIAAALNRSYNSVHGRIVTDGLRPKPAKAAPPETTYITKDHVVEYYLSGWRFVGFSHAGMCRMERSPCTIKSLHRDGVHTQTPCITPQVVCEVG